VESTGALKPEEIVINALRVLERKLDITKVRISADGLTACCSAAPTATGAGFGV